MLAFIKGVVAYKDAQGAIIEAGGIGYELSMSLNALAALPQVGNPTQVWTYMSVKDDGISLFGFSQPAEKDLFCKLITVNGVGPKMAVSALSTFKPQDLVACIASGDAGAIATIPGVGKKTAQRMIVDLQGVLGEAGTGALALSEESDAMRDAASALQSMGFSADEVAAALKGCAESEASAIIRYALKHMGGAR